MTRPQIDKLVAKWQRRLKLDHWDIKVDWSKPAKDESFATTWRMNSYDRAEIYFDPAFTTWDAVFTEKTIVHELLHLVTRDLDRVLGDVDGMIHPEAFRAVDKRYEHEIEGVVDRLAAILVEVAA